MSDEERTRLERAIQRAFRPQRRLSRRAFMRQAGKGGAYAAGALSLPAILAACGIGAQSTAPSAGQSVAAPSLGSEPAGTLDWANWPAYIDIDEESGDYPTIQAFEEEYGITVNYTEAINDNEEFFGIVQPDLAAGRSPGYDLIVMTDWMIERMIRLGYLMPLDKSKLTTWDENVQDLYRDPWYDPGNQYSIAYQSGITGIGFNPTLTGRPITKFDDLLDPEFAGRVGMFAEMRDTMHLTMLSMGVEPQDATLEDAEAARDKLLGPSRNGQFRNFYGNDYYDALAAGDLAVCIAWSGDVSQMKLYDNSDVEFIVPEDGGMLWVDNMAIPAQAEHPVDAHLMMDYWYRLDAQVPLIEYVGYFSPVTGVADRVREDAETAREEGDDEWADALEVIAETAFPDNDTLQNVHTYKQLTEEEERDWNELFNEVVQGG
jgi:spermidine/putrescine transport system substrate-binding protein